MELRRFCKKYILPLFFLSLFMACESPQETEAREEIQEFEAWFNEQSQEAKVWSQQEWETVKEEYNEFEAEMEGRLSELSEESKQKYNELKTHFKEWEAEVESELEDNELRYAKAQQMKAWKSQLLGQYADSASITDDNAKAVYETFMKNVRDQHDAWTEVDWEWAENVYELLNERKDQVEESIPLEDEIKIKALQAEFKTLQAGEEVKDVIN